MSKCSRWPDHPLSQAALHLALAPKSTSAYRAIGAAMELVEKLSPLDMRPPPGFRSAAAGPQYVYPPAFGGYIEQDCLPEKLAGRVFFCETSFDPPPSRTTHSGR
eukprot:gnl/Dysnectes_brevis/3981_a5189_486.p1 GENE.gnl/Dysnectes_brevis/3981_a5189_486~~gnl/Dysnectes_brevis/3981_a5189_486.p1  ORF type:complete len:105 (-),score=14.31 gnl/Dysnectes_brevis/3981_a5189_486:324-638(-)